MLIHNVFILLTIEKLNKELEEKQAEAAANKSESERLKERLLRIDREHKEPDDEMTDRPLDPTQGTSADEDSR